jgi:hypothetical protein
MYTRLVTYKQEHGHCFVVLGFMVQGEDKKQYNLGAWVQGQQHEFLINHLKRNGKKSSTG